MKILAIRFSSMGDVILTVPLFTFIKKNFPESEIFFITKKEYRDLFIDDPRLSSVIALSYRDTEDVLTKLAKQDWDLLIDLQNNRRSIRLRKKHFPKVKYGIFNKLHLKRILLLYLRINLYKKNNNVIIRYIKASGLAPDPQIKIPSIKLYFNNNNLDKNSAIYKLSLSLNSKPVVALIPFSAWKNKQWPLDSFASVGKYFLKKNWNVVIFGGQGDIENADKLKRDIGVNSCSLAGEVSLYETGIFFKQCRLALGIDTGLSHLARSCGVKTGIIYGSTTWHFGFFPFGKPAFRIFQAKIFCRPCHPHGGNICWRISRQCLKKISVEQVIKGMEELLIYDK